MLTVDCVETSGWHAAITGMRNPMNSWDKCDSMFISNSCVELGPNDLKLASALANGGGPHAKFRRMINVTMVVTAPLYWWKEFDTYKIGTVANSCSTMHKIHSKEFTIDDFSHEHLMGFNDSNDCPLVELDDCDIDPEFMLNLTINLLNLSRKLYLKTKDKRYWWQMIQLLPSSYNQLRNVQINYEVASEIYKWRKDHKLDEWHTFINEAIVPLPYFKELIEYS